MGQVRLHDETEFTLEIDAIRFSFRTLLIVVVVAAVSVVIWDRSDSTRQRRAMAWIRDQGGELWLEIARDGSPKYPPRHHVGEPPGKWGLVFPGETKIDLEVLVAHLKCFERLESVGVNYARFPIGALEVQTMEELEERVYHSDSKEMRLRMREVSRKAEAKAETPSRPKPIERRHLIDGFYPEKQNRHDYEGFPFPPEDLRDLRSRKF